MGGSSWLRSTGIVALQCLIVLASIALTSVVAAEVQQRSIRAGIEERVLDVATSLAELPVVRESVTAEQVDATAALQSLSDTVHAASGVDYVVITDDEGIRLTHPDPSAVGQPVSTDPSTALGGETFLDIQTGTLGPTLRAKVPVVDGDAVVGMVSVGILESRMTSSFREAVGGMLPWVVASAVVGCVGAALVTNRLNRRVRALTAQTRELETQRRIARALREQTHEFHTRLHVIRGLVAQDEAPAALGYIDEIAPVTGARSGGEHDGPRADDARLRALLDGISAELASAGATLQVEGDAPTGAAPEGLLTTLSNLCRNAAEAGAHLVRITWAETDSSLLVSIDDDGPGIPREVMTRLFHRGTSTKPDATGFGRGIGLDLVRREVTELGGTIEVGASALGGTRFLVEVPDREVSA